MLLCAVDFVLHSLVLAAAVACSCPACRGCLSCHILSLSGCRCLAADPPQSLVSIFRFVLLHFTASTPYFSDFCGCFSSGRCSAAICFVLHFLGSTLSQFYGFHAFLLPWLPCDISVKALLSGSVQLPVLHFVQLSFTAGFTVYLVVCQTAPGEPSKARERER